jgi:hypothetical protein
MTDITIHRLVKQSYEVSQAIERCGASPELTEAVIKSSALTRALAEYFVADDHVAWLRSVGNTDDPHRHLQLCDSDSPGAFKVYRRMP